MHNIWVLCSPDERYCWLRLADAPTDRIAFVDGYSPAVVTLPVRMPPGDCAHSVTMAQSRVIQGRTGDAGQGELRPQDGLVCRAQRRPAAGSSQRCCGMKYIDTAGQQSALHCDQMSCGTTSRAR